jgi:hypothetical protein
MNFVRTLRFCRLLVIVRQVRAQDWLLQQAGDGARVVVETGVKCQVLGNKETIPVGMPIRGATEIKEGSKTLYAG